MEPSRINDIAFPFQGIISSNEKNGTSLIRSAMAHFVMIYDLVIGKRRPQIAGFTIPCFGLITRSHRWQRTTSGGNFDNSPIANFGVAPLLLVSFFFFFWFFSVMRSPVDRHYQSASRCIEPNPRPTKKTNAGQTRRVVRRIENGSSFFLRLF